LLCFIIAEYSVFEWNAVCKVNSDWGCHVQTRFIGKRELVFVSCVELLRNLTHCALMLEKNYWELEQKYCLRYLIYGSVVKVNLIFTYSCS